MDWDNKFYSIVKETEDNLAKAKKKLGNKSSAAIGDLPPGILTTTDRSNSKYTQRNSVFGPLLNALDIGIPTTIDSSESKPFQHSCTLVPLPDTANMNMSIEHGMQIRHLQEQISYQNKTIEKLERLVTSLNSERDFYKEQMSELKGEVERLTDNVSRHSTAASSERQVLAMKRELMHEIENVKTMLQNYAQETNKTKNSSLSSPWNDDFWTMKENLTESLEQVHKELSLMNKRIDRMESELATQSFDTARPISLSKDVRSRSQFMKPSVLYTPVYKANDEVNSLDVQQLRESVNSLNSKLDSFERKIDVVHPKQPQVYPSYLTGCSKHTYNPTSRKYSAIDVNDDSLESLSDLSEMSSLSGHNTDDSTDVLSFELQGSTTSKRRLRRRSKNKTAKSKAGKTEFSLSDSDLDDVCLDTDSLD